MDDQECGKNEKERTSDTREETSDISSPEIQSPGRGLTLEEIVTKTGEIEHLNELIILNLKKAGGFTCTEDYLVMVAPILDLLEVEIRVRFRPGMTVQQMKLIVQDWIDDEISRLK